MIDLLTEDWEQINGITRQSYLDAHQSHLNVLNNTEEELKGCDKAILSCVNFDAKYYDTHTWEGWILHKGACSIALTCQNILTKEPPSKK